jgi:hypothetical protein
MESLMTLTRKDLFHWGTIRDIIASFYVTMEKEKSVLESLGLDEDVLKGTEETNVEYLLAGSIRGNLKRELLGIPIGHRIQIFQDDESNTFTVEYAEEEKGSRWEVNEANWEKNANVMTVTFDIDIKIKPHLIADT